MHLVLAKTNDGLYQFDTNLKSKLLLTINKTKLFIVNFNPLKLKYLTIQKLDYSLQITPFKEQFKCIETLGELKKVNYYNQKQLKQLLSPYMGLSLLSKEAVWDALSYYYDYEELRRYFDEELVYEADLAAFLEEHGAKWIGTEEDLHSFARLVGKDVDSTIIDYDIGCVFINGRAYYIAFNT